MKQSAMVKTKSVFKEIKYMRKLLITLVLFVSSHSILAQDLERAQELVEHVRQMMTPSDIETVEAKTFQTNFRTGETDNIEQFYDLKEQRVLTLLLDAEGQKVSETIFENGHMKTSMEIAGETTVNELVDMTPTAMQMLTAFSAQLKEFRVFLPKNYELMSYDGGVNYGNNVQGEQVTLAYYDTRKNNNYTVVSYVFSKSGELIASFFPGETAYLALHEIFGFGDYLRVKTKVFIIENNTAYPFSEIREDYRFNRNIEDTQFANY
jgi:hypothetical protein